MKTYTIDCKEILDRISAHEYIADILEFPEYYGKNLDALFDCLTDMGECTIRIINIDSLVGINEYAGKLLAVFEEATKANSNITLMIENEDTVGINIDIKNTVDDEIIVNVETTEDDN